MINNTSIRHALEERAGLLKRVDDEKKPLSKSEIQELNKQTLTYKIPCGKGGTCYYDPKDRTCVYCGGEKYLGFVKRG